jgi:hypothetical protein
MLFQRLMAASGAATMILAAGCATTSGVARSAAHAGAPAMPTSLSRVEIARDYLISPAAPLTIAASAEPSFALAHEGAELQPKAGSARRHSGAPTKNFALLAAADLPEGWAYDANQAIRHGKSGLACPTTINIEDEERRFTLRELQTFDAKGLDIGCNYSTDDGAYLTLYASFWPEMSLEESVAGAIAAIKLRFDVKRSLPVAIAMLSSEGDSPLFKDLEKPSAAAFDIGETSGTPYKAALWLVKTHGWHVKARATYPQEDLTSEIISSIMFAFSHLQVRAKNMADPVTAGGEV